MFSLVWGLHLTLTGWKQAGSLQSSLSPGRQLAEGSWVLPLVAWADVCPHAAPGHAHLPPPPLTLPGGLVFRVGGAASPAGHGDGFSCTLLHGLTWEA